MLHDAGLREWFDEAPFDAMLVFEAVPPIPETLKNQLAQGGRMVVTVGPDDRAQELVRLTRREKGKFDREYLADLRFVPSLDDQGIVGESAWGTPRSQRPTLRNPRQAEGLPGLIRAHAEAFEDVVSAPLGMLMDRMGDARIDHYVRHREAPASDWEPFARFPTWMRCNQETRAFADWLHDWNAPRASEKRVGFYGLDLYSLFNFAQATVDYLEDADPDLARLARELYGCLSPWEADSAAYGRAALTGAHRGCEGEVVAMLADLMRKRQDYATRDGDRFLDAAQNAALVANTENYYRMIYCGSRAAWNLRDDHMFETLQNVLKFHGPGVRAVVWAHNSHIGDARATKMSRRVERNLRELCVRGFGSESYRIWFGTDHDIVAEASDWDGPMEIMLVRPAHPQSHERQFHLTGLPGLILPMRAGRELDVATELSHARLERAIGLIYRPETEFASLYFEVELPRQFDEYVWIDKTSAVRPLEAVKMQVMPDTYPFGVLQGRHRPAGPGSGGCRCMMQVNALTCALSDRNISARGYSGPCRSRPLRLQRRAWGRGRRMAAVGCLFDCRHQSSGGTHPHSDQPRFQSRRNHTCAVHLRRRQRVARLPLDQPARRDEGAFDGLQ